LILTEFANPNGTSSNKISRNFLKDQVLKYLRDQIVSGQIEQGAKLVERELAEQIGISRIPARDALLQLEAEGLVVSQSNGRYVIEISEQDIFELYQVRLSLETLAAELAAKNNSPDNREALTKKLQDMKAAITNNNAEAFLESDVEIHRLIWFQANNRHLLKPLNGMIGPISMFMARHSKYYSFDLFTLDLHVDLVQCINDGNVQGAQDAMKRHMGEALQRSLNVFLKKT